MAARTYFVVSEGAGILNPGERPFRSLDKAVALAVQAAEECSWACMTPPSPDNEVIPGKGNFRCGVMAAHGIHIQVNEGGRVLEGEAPDIPDEQHRRARNTAHADWALEVVIDRGTGYLADGEDTLFYAGPELTDVGWDEILADVADGDEIVEARVKVLGHGRYSHLLANNEDYPMEWRRGRGF